MLWALTQNNSRNYVTNPRLLGRFFVRLVHNSRQTSLGARAMHGFGAEVFIEEVQCYDDNDMMIYSTGLSFLA